MRLCGILAALALAAGTAIAQAESCAMARWGNFLASGPQSFEMTEVLETEAGPVAVFVFGPLAGVHGKLFAFMLRGEECFTRIVSVGSYDATTKAAIALGDIKDGERIYHIDLYEAERHVTLSIGKDPPDFETAKRLALETLR